MDLNFGKNTGGIQTGATEPTASISLKKGQTISLKKGNTAISKVLVGLGWDVSGEVGVDFDLDASAFILDSNGRVLGDKSFVFYGNLVSPCGAIKHMGDNRTGAGDGDDEQIEVDFSKLPPEAEKVVFSVTIYDEANDPTMNFARVSDAFIRVVDSSTNKEFARLDLANDFSFEKSMLPGQFIKVNGEWTFEALEQGVAGDLSAICSTYGVSAK